MKGLIRLVSSAALVLTMVAGAASVDMKSAFAAFVNGDEVVVFDGALNLRQTPGLAGLILQVLPDGTPLTVTGNPQTVDAIEWYPVTTAAAVNGWVAGQFIKAAGGTGEFSIGDEVVVADGPLNLRSAAGSGSAVVELLNTGVKGTIKSNPTVANDLDWYQLDVAPEDGNADGWVAGDFLDLAGDEGQFQVGDEIYVFDGPVNMRNAAGLSGLIVQVLPQDMTATVLGGPTNADGYEWYQLDLSPEDDNADGWVAGDFLALDDDNGPIVLPGNFEEDSFVFVNTAKLNLRQGSDLDAAIVKSMLDGDVAQVTGDPVSNDGYTWYPVDVPGGPGSVSGWVAGEFLVGGILLGEDAIVADGPLNLREEATTASTAIKVLQTSDVIHVESGPVIAGGYAWFEVTSGSDTGFVVGRYLVLAILA